MSQVLIHATILLFASLACRAPSVQGEVDEPLRLGMAFGPRVTAAYENRPTPLFYGAGFLPKIPVFETLVGMDRSGAPTPGLAESWEVSADARQYTFRLRDGARFHDGRPCDAAAVVAHFQRLGSAEDMFIGMFRFLDRVVALDTRTVQFQMTRPYPLLLDLPILNPNGVVVPDARRDAEPAVLIGTGPFSFESFAPMDRAVYQAVPGSDRPSPQVAQLELRLFAGGGKQSGVLAWALQRGKVDGIIEDWYPSISRQKLPELEAAGFRVHETRGSAVTLLAIQTGRAPFDQLEHRRFLAGLLDREQFIDAVEFGRADPVDTVFSPGVAGWPSRELREPEPGGQLPEGLRDSAPVLLVSAEAASVLAGLEIARQCHAAGLRLQVETILPGTSGWTRVNSGDYDLLLTRTWGIPYDPNVSMIARLLPPPAVPTAVETRPYTTAPELNRLIEQSWDAAANVAERERIYGRIQAYLDEHALLIPLCMPRRIAVLHPEVEGFSFGEHGYTLDLSRIRKRSRRAANTAP